jgi:hypothetical protein
MPLLLPVAIDGFSVLLAVLFPIVRVRLPPFLLARTHVFGVVAIVADPFAMIIAAPMPLTIRLITDALLWSIT